MSLGINLGAQNLGPNSSKYFSPIFVGQILENIFHPYSLVRFLKIFFTHIRWSNSVENLPISVGGWPIFLGGLMGPIQSVWALLNG